jgi:hypothetical protein
LGRAALALPAFFPVKYSVSAFRNPRGTVPSTSGRDDNPSLKKVDERYGFIFG